MDVVAALYHELDPLQPLAADDALYVDWQHELDPDGADVRSQLVRIFTRNASPDRPIARLLTGHKGSGKTTELNRVTSTLCNGTCGKKVFVSTLYAQRWLDIQDVQPEDVVLQIVRQLAADLKTAGIDLGERRLRDFFDSLWNRAKGTLLDSIKVGVDPLTFNFRLKASLMLAEISENCCADSYPQYTILSTGSFYPRLVDTYGTRNSRISCS